MNDLSLFPYMIGCEFDNVFNAQKSIAPRGLIGTLPVEGCEVVISVWVNSECVLQMYCSRLFYNSDT